jgi:hypothetical protein
VQLALGIPRLTPVVCEFGRPLADAVADGVFEVLRDLGVPLPAHRARERRVGHLPDQHVLEDELRIALQAGSRLAPNEIPLLEAIEEVVHAAAVSGCDRTAPEDLSDDRGMQEQRRSSVGSVSGAR